MIFFIDAPKALSLSAISRRTSSKLRISRVLIKLSNKMAFHESEVCQCWEEKRYLHTDTNCSPIPLKGGAPGGPCVCPPCLLCGRHGSAEPLWRSVQTRTRTRETRPSLRRPLHVAPSRRQGQPIPGPVRTHATTVDPRPLCPRPRAAPLGTA